MKNPERIKELARAVITNLENSKQAQRIGTTLEKYSMGKIDWAKAGRSAFVFGAVLTFIPQLLMNYFIPARQVDNNK